MTTQLVEARDGRITPAMEAVAVSEQVDASKVREQVALGHAVIPCNPSHEGLCPAVVGREFRTKINANIGYSPDKSSVEEEQDKLQVAVSAGADFIMDLSVGPESPQIRRAMLSRCKVPLGTVPLYEAFHRTGSDFRKLDPDEVISVIKTQAEEGVDFMTIHAGLLRPHVDLAIKRLMGIVSRGGALLARWMVEHDCENPFYDRWDDILDICLEHDVTVSLGDGLRPGCLADASDEAQFAELDVLGELVTRTRERGVQVMVEGPGHIPFGDIKMNVERQQEVCDKAPFYVLGPIVTDIAPGYDHITSCIGATEAAVHGASLLCYVTPAEHLGLPSCEDVKTGVIAYRIAAHAADVSRGLPGARDLDDEMSRARVAFDWNRQFELAMDGETARARYEKSCTNPDGESDFCSMCGQEFCAIRNSKQLANHE
jgi:phosphomethylpyrimidine synthase